MSLGSAERPKRWRSGMQTTAAKPQALDELKAVNSNRTQAGESRAANGEGSHGVSETACLISYTTATCMMRRLCGLSTCQDTRSRTRREWSQSGTLEEGSLDQGPGQMPRR